MNVDEQLQKSGLQYWLESLQDWKKRLGRGFRKDIPMRGLNRSRRNLAKAIREAETKLNRPHRYLPKLGAVQYMGNGK